MAHPKFIATDNVGLGWVRETHIFVFSRLRNKRAEFVNQDVLEIHSEDALKLNLQTGDTVKLFSHNGRL